MLSPSDLLAMLEDAVHDELERRTTLVSAQTEAAETLITALEELPFRQRLTAVQRFLDWDTVPVALADTAQWPVDYWQVQVGAITAYLRWVAQSHAALLQFWRSASRSTD